MLTDDRIEEIVAAGVKSGSIPWAGFKPDAEGKHTLPVLSKMHIQLARAIEAEVRKDDEALIRQMLDFAELVKRGLEQGTVKAQPIIEIDDDAQDLVIKTLHGEATSAIAAARARLEKAP